MRPNKIVAYIDFQIFPDHSVKIADRIPGCIAVQHFHGVHILFGQQIIQRADVLSHFDINTFVGAYQFE